MVVTFHVPYLLYCEYSRPHPFPTTHVKVHGNMYTFVLWGGALWGGAPSSFNKCSIPPKSCSPSQTTTPDTHPPPSSPTQATPPDDPCQWCVLEQLFSHGCPLTTPPQGGKGGWGNPCQSAMPHWVGGADTVSIVHGFASLKQTLRDCVEKMSSLEGLKDAVLGISGAPLHNVAMFGDHAHTIQRLSAHSEVLEVVHQYTSWAGHDVMPHLLQSLRGEARREREVFYSELQSYRKRLVEYRRLRLWECPPLVTCHTSLPSGGQYLLVKPVGVAEPTLFGLEQFHNRMSKSLNLPPYALKLCMVCGVCGGVVYCVPKGVYQEVFKSPLTPEQQREASLTGMKELTVVDPVSVCDV